MIHEDELDSKTRVRKRSGRAVHVTTQDAMHELMECERAGRAEIQETEHNGDKMSFQVLLWFSLWCTPLHADEMSSTFPCLSQLTDLNCFSVSGSLFHSSLAACSRVCSDNV